MAPDAQDLAVRRDAGERPKLSAEFRTSTIWPVSRFFNRNSLAVDDARWVLPEKTSDRTGASYSSREICACG